LLSQVNVPQRAEQEVEIQTGGQPESLRGKMAQVDLRLGWSRQIKTPTSYVDLAPEGQRDFMRREPAGFDTFGALESRCVVRAA